MFERLKRKIKKVQIGFKLLYIDCRLRVLIHGLDGESELRKAIKLAEQQLLLIQELYELFYAKNDYTGMVTASRTYKMIDLCRGELKSELDYFYCGGKR